MRMITVLALTNGRNRQNGNSYQWKGYQWKTHSWDVSPVSVNAAWQSKFQQEGYRIFFSILKKFLKYIFYNLILITPCPVLPTFTNDVAAQIVHTPHLVVREADQEVKACPTHLCIGLLVAYRPPRTHARYIAGISLRKAGQEAEEGIGFWVTIMSQHNGCWMECSVR